MAAVVIGVAGGSGSGKTTVVERLCGALEPVAATVLEHDRYYRNQSHLSLADRQRTNYDHPDALETDLLVRDLGELLDGKSITAPVYDFSTHTRAIRTDRIEPSPIVIVEGILILTDARLRSLMALRVFVDTDDTTRLQRRVERDSKERGRSATTVVEQFVTTVLPMHREYVEPTKAFADVVIAEGGHNKAAIERLAAAIHSLAAGTGRL